METRMNESSPNAAAVLQGEIALVTGASRGIGAAIADQLAAHGATVIGTATSDDGARAIGERLAACGGYGRRLDLTEAASTEALIDEIGKQFGAIDILVNNAGITRDNLLMRRSREWRPSSTTISPRLPHLESGLARHDEGAQGPHHQYLLGDRVTVNAGQANYAAAKAGVIAFSKSLAKEIGSRGITVNVVAPGFIATDMTKDLPENARESLLGQIALGRLGEPADIARAVAFLAGPGQYITAKPCL